MIPEKEFFEALLAECRFTAVRSSGKGGQNVNKLSTKVILQFDVLNSQVLSESQKALLLDRLHTRISKDGIFRLSSGRERTQLANRDRVTEKFAALLEMAFTPDIERIATRPTRASKERRISEKRSQSARKEQRSGQWDDATDE